VPEVDTDRLHEAASVWRRRPRRRHTEAEASSAVFIASGAVEAAALHAAVLETGGRIRRGRGRCGRVSLL